MPYGAYISALEQSEEHQKFKKDVKKLYEKKIAQLNWDEKDPRREFFHIGLCVCAIYDNNNKLIIPQENGRNIISVVPFVGKIASLNKSPKQKLKDLLLRAFNLGVGLVILKAIPVHLAKIVGLTNIVYRSEGKNQYEKWVDSMDEETVIAILGALQLTPIAMSI